VWSISNTCLLENEYEYASWWIPPSDDLGGAEGTLYIVEYDHGVISFPWNHPIEMAHKVEEFVDAAGNLLWCRAGLWSPPGWDKNADVFGERMIIPMLSVFDTLGWPLDEDELVQELTKCQVEVLKQLYEDRECGGLSAFMQLPGDECGAEVIVGFVMPDFSSRVDVSRVTWTFGPNAYMHENIVHGGKVVLLHSGTDELSLKDVTFEEMRHVYDQAAVRAGFRTLPPIQKAEC
jgi:hypothetical protein